jgi:hypothetical protein
MGVSDANNNGAEQCSVVLPRATRACIVRVGVITALRRAVSIRRARVAVAVAAHVSRLRLGTERLLRALGAVAAGDTAGDTARASSCLHREKAHRGNRQARSASAW